VLTAGQVPGKAGVDSYPRTGTLEDVVGEDRCYAHDQPLEDTTAGLRPSCRMMLSICSIAICRRTGPISRSKSSRWSKPPPAWTTNCGATVTGPPPIGVPTL